MAYDLRDGQGTLFINKSKKKETQPDLEGKISINGVVFRLAAWRRLGKSGDPWFSIQAAPLEKKL